MKIESPLLNHVRRHEQMPVIFRAAAVSRSGRQSGSSPAVPLVRATLPGPSVEAPTELAMEIERPAAVQPTPMPNPSVSASIPVQPLQRQAVSAPPQPVPETKPAVSQLSQPASTQKPDPDWGRLQAINQAHRRKQQTAAETPPPAGQMVEIQQQIESLPTASKPPQPSPRAAKILGRKSAPPRMPQPEEKKRSEITFLAPEEDRVEGVDRPKIETDGPPKVEKLPGRFEKPTAVQRTVEPPSETSGQEPAARSPLPVEGSGTDERPAAKPTDSAPEATGAADTIVSQLPRRPILETAGFQPREKQEREAQSAEPQPTEHRTQAAPEVIRRQVTDEAEQEAFMPASVETPSLPQQQPYQRVEPESTIISPGPLSGQKGELSYVQRQEHTTGPTPESPANAEPDNDRLQPLEAVWPVQRLPEPGVVAEPASTIPATGQRGGRDRAAEGRVRETLETVAAGRASDSGVELVMTKRPRPVQHLRKRSLPAGKPALQRMEDVKQRIQRETAEAGVVETEIGPLPGDLWRLLGQSPPVGETAVQEDSLGDAAVDTGVGEAVAAPANRFIQRQVLEEAGSPAPKSEPVRRVETVTPPIQRARFGAGSEAVRVEGGNEAETAGKEVGDQPDIEALSRQVYQRIKRYLAVERERGRGRF